MCALRNEAYSAWRLGGKLPCASGSDSTQEAGTRRKRLALGDAAGAYVSAWVCALRKEAKRPKPEPTSYSTESTRTAWVVEAEAARWVEGRSRCDRRPLGSKAPGHLDPCEGIGQLGACSWAPPQPRIGTHAARALLPGADRRSSGALGGAAWALKLLRPAQGGSMGPATSLNRAAARTRPVAATAAAACREARSRRNTARARWGARTPTTPAARAATLPGQEQSGGSDVSRALKAQSALSAMFWQGS